MNEIINIKGRLVQSVTPNLQMVFDYIRFSIEPCSVYHISRGVKKRMYRSNIYDYLRELLKSNVIQEVISPQGTKLYKVIKQKELGAMGK